LVRRGDARLRSTVATASAQNGAGTRVRLAASIAFVIFAVTGGVLLTTPSLAVDHLHIDVFPQNNFKMSENVQARRTGGSCWPGPFSRTAECGGKGSLAFNRPPGNMKESCWLHITLVDPGPVHKMRWDAAITNRSGSCHLKFVNDHTLDFYVDT
jgi:hypothetical protein